MIRRLVSGMYSYLPMGYRVIRKVEEIIRQEMDKAGSQEMLMPTIQPKEMLAFTGRWDNFGVEMFKFRDGNSNEFCLGSTNEEYFTNLIKGEVKSYKQLPLNLYQIQTNYRDEKRPRFGLLRCREFIMKDAYSFNIDEENMKQSYKQMQNAYEGIFTRLKLSYKMAESDAGTMEGKVSHEYIAISDIGESNIAYCDHCDYAATDKKAPLIYKVHNGDVEELKLEKVYTPGARTIESLTELLKMDHGNFGKALIFEAAGKTLIAIIPGDRELSERKLCNYLGIREDALEMSNEDTIVEITGASKGYTGPISLRKEVRIILDSRITKMKNLVVGGNETDYHFKNANYGRDFKGEIVEDLLLIKEGDICPKCEKNS